MSPRTNYKAKWQSALAASDGDSVTEKQKRVQTIVDETTAGSINVAMMLRSLHEPMIKAATNSHNLVAVMDYYKSVGPIEFGETCLQIDKQLCDMSMPVIARRIRDSVQLAEARIGILSEALLEAYDTINNMQTAYQSLEKTYNDMSAVVTETCIIGRSVTQTDLDEVDRLESLSDFKRFGLEYFGMSDDNMVNIVNATKAVYTRRARSRSGFQKIRSQRASRNLADELSDAESEGRSSADDDSGSEAEESESETQPVQATTTNALVKRNAHARVDSGYVDTSLTM